MTLRSLKLKGTLLTVLFVTSMFPFSGCRASCSGDGDVEDAVEEVADAVEDAVD
ncbi:MAG: hypothetical protein H6818_02260 [Phycisphaerales bacterium]|nr:hypothetical protein [Phycisphaerales bacterium]MCB9863137.1 hypothetical protein [Phycisphaerales bacterium]